MEKYEPYSRIGKGVAALTDIFLVGVGFYLAYQVFGLYHRYHYGAPPADISAHTWILMVFIPSLLFLFNHYELLSRGAHWHSSPIIIRVSKAFVLVGIVLSGSIFLAKAQYYSRFLLALMWLFSFALVLGEKILFNILNRKGFLQWGTPRNAVVVGRGEKREKAVKQIQKKPGLRLLQDEHFDLSVELEDFRAYLLNNPVDEVYFVLPRESVREGFHIDRFLMDCERMGVAVHVVVNMVDIFQYFSVAFSRLERLPTLVFRPPKLDPDRIVSKRIIDMIGALIGLTVTGALTPVIAAAIKLDSEGPVFFSQKRVGQHGRYFTLYKFRSMYDGASEMKPELAEADEMDGPMFKISDDPRITRVGRILRRFSLDELPQLWNVLKGDMSLVGTRPPTPDEVEHYELWHYRRLSIKPGLTGLWQVSGRHEVNDFKDVVRLDLAYVDRASLWLDLKILARTLVSFARGR